MNELQAVMLDLFKDFKRVCEKHNIRYFLIGGTALGAIRHQGFIPWDDDLDIGMPRKDYDKLMTLKDEFSHPYFLQNFKTDKSFALGYAKLRHSDTSFIENFYKFQNINHGIWIDIFPIDGMSKRKNAKKALGPKPYILWWMFYLAYIGHFFAPLRKNTWFIQLPLYLVSLIALPFNICNYMTRLIILWMKRIKWDKATLVGSYMTWAFNKEALPKHFYGEGLKVKFEGIDAVVPTNYDAYLTAKYGDYMKLPPPEKQLGHHYHSGVSTTISYIDYLNGKR